MRRADGDCVIERDLISPLRLQVMIMTMLQRACLHKLQWLAVCVPRVFFFSHEGRHVSTGVDVIVGVSERKRRGDKSTG